MNRKMLTLVAGALALLLPVPASAACKPVPAKKWAGTIQVVNHASATQLSFLANKCKLADSRMHGTDALVFNVASHRGLKAAAKWTTTAPVRPEQVDGFFYTSACTGLPGTGWTQRTPGKSVSFTIPSGAKWLVVAGYTVTPAKDIAVTVSSAGRKCR